MSKEWPALGQEQQTRRKFVPKASSFAAAVKIQDESAKSSGTQATVPNPSDGQPSGGGMSWEEKKAAMRAAKLAQKDEKRIKREENARRQLLAPKGYRVQMIQRNPLIKAPIQHVPASTALESSSFPELGSAPKAAQTGTPTAPVAEVSVPKQEPDTLGFRKKKPEKYLTVDLEALLQRTSKKVVAKKKRIKIKSVRPEKEKLSGNPLDSSQPVRHRGKVRECPKKKRKSSLKNVIVAYRKLKELQKNELVKKAFDLEDVEEDKAEGEETKKEVEEKSVESDISPSLEVPPLKEPIEKSETSGSQFVITAEDLIHSRKFRDYCDNILGKDLDDSVQSFLKNIVDMQDRSYHKDPVKHKKRILCGLHEAKKSIVMKKTKILILAPDLEKCPQEGGLDSKIAELINLCKTNGTPYAFALGRRKLGKVMLKKVPVSCAAVVNADGAEEQLAVVLSLLSSMKQSYQTATFRKSELGPDKLFVDTKSDINKLVVSSLLSALEQSLQAPKIPEFLKVIESLHVDEESD